MRSECKFRANYTVAPKCLVASGGAGWGVRSVIYVTAVWYSRIVRVFLLLARLSVFCIIFTNGRTCEVCV
jgi:hypothetical protein